MNFFGHATVASRIDARRGVVLGAMLPDFAAMLGERIPTSSAHDVTRGIRLHHETDAAFHDAPQFCELSRESARWLGARGLPRGSARAIGHVGVEILLDELLARDLEACANYRDALHAGREAGLGRQIHWRSQGARDRFFDLLVTLEGRAPDGTTHDSERVALRLLHILAPRPRLAFDSERLANVTCWVDHARPKVAVAAPELLQVVLARLALTGSASRPSSAVAAPTSA